MTSFQPNEVNLANFEPPNGALNEAYVSIFSWGGKNPPKRYFKEKKIRILQAIINRKQSIFGLSFVKNFIDVKFCKLPLALPTFAPLEMNQLCEKLPNILSMYGRWFRLLLKLSWGLSMVQNPMSVPKKGKKSVALRSITFCSNLKEKKGENCKSIFRIFNRPIMGFCVLKKKKKKKKEKEKKERKKKLTWIFIF